MSRAVTDLVREMRMPDTMTRQRRRSGKLVLQELADRCDIDGRNAFPSRHTIARRSEMSARNVEYVLDQLEVEGLIKLQAPAKRHRPTTYQLNLERIRELAPPEAWERFEGARLANSDGQSRKSEAQGRKFEGSGSQRLATDPSDPVDRKIQEGTGRASTRPFRPTPKKASLREQLADDLEVLTGRRPR